MILVFFSIRSENFISFGGLGKKCFFTCESLYIGQKLTLSKNWLCEVTEFLLNSPYMLSNVSPVSKIRNSRKILGTGFKFTDVASMWKNSYLSLTYLSQLMWTNNSVNPKVPAHFIAFVPSLDMGDKRPPIFKIALKNYFTAIPRDFQSLDLNHSESMWHNFLELFWKSGSKLVKV